VQGKGVGNVIPGGELNQVAGREDLVVRIRDWRL
jgi:hypothetical protein